MAKAQDLITVLAARARFEPVDVKEGPDQIRILGRVRTDGSASVMSNWLNMMNAIAEREERPDCPWQVDISRKYFRRGGRLIFAWRLIIQGKGLDALLPEIINAAQGAVTEKSHEVMEVPLLGGANRNALRNGRGAGATGTVPVGPAALINRGGG